MVAERLDGRRIDVISAGLGIGPTRSGGKAELGCDVSEIAELNEGDAIEGEASDETRCSLWPLVDGGGAIPASVDSESRSSKEISSGNALK